MKIKEFFFLLLAHHSRDNLSHTIRISIRKHEIYLCARCTSIYISLAISFLLFSLVIDISYLPIWSIYIIAYSLGTPVIISWSKQTLTGRDNSNKTRILTGLMGGIGLALLFYFPTPYRELSIFGIFGTIFFILYFGKIRRYKKEYSKFEHRNSD